MIKLESVKAYESLLDVEVPVVVNDGCIRTFGMIVGIQTKGLDLNNTEHDKVLVAVNYGDKFPLSVPTEIVKMMKFDKIDRFDILEEEDVTLDEITITNLETNFEGFAYLWVSLSELNVVPFSLLEEFQEVRCSKDFIYNEDIAEWLENESVQFVGEKDLNLFI